MSQTSFFAMGGYAAYVWPAWGLSLVALAVIGWMSWRWMRRVERLAAHPGSASLDGDPASRPPSEPVG